MTIKNKYNRSGIMHVKHLKIVPKGYNRAKLSHIFMDTFLNPCFNLVFDECEKGEITWVK